MAGNDILHALSISPQVIVSQQLGTADASIYSVGLGKSVKIAHGTLCNVTSQLVTTQTLGTTSTTGGTFAAGAYFWKITAKNATGESLPSNEVTATLSGTTSTQVLSWTAVPTATSYNVYRGTAAGAEGTLVTTVTTLTYTDTGTAGTAQALPTASTFATAVNVYLSVIASGGTVGDGTHRVIHNYSLAANDTLSLKDYLGGAMLGPSDAIAAFAGSANSVDLVITGTVHA